MIFEGEYEHLMLEYFHTGGTVEKNLWVQISTLFFLLCDSLGYKCHTIDLA